MATWVLGLSGGVRRRTQETVEHDAFDVFISYAHADEKFPSDTVADEKVYGQAGEIAKWLEELGFSVWWDRKMLVGDDWHEIITTKMQAARRIVALWSKHSLGRPMCIYEALFAAGAKSPAGGFKLLPLTIEALANTDLPEELEGLAHRFNRIDWRDQPAARTNLLAKLELEPSTTNKGVPVRALSDRVAYALPSGATRLIGRDTELSMLRKAWDETHARAPAVAKTNVVVLRAVGGAGKTALVRRFVDDLADTKFKGAARVFGWSAYSQGSGEDKVIDADAFLNAALRHFGHDLDAAPVSGAADKGHLLARLVGAGRNLLVIDGLEPLQHPPYAIAPSRQGLDGKPVEEVRRSGAVKDKGVAARTAISLL